MSNLFSRFGSLNRVSICTLYLVIVSGLLLANFGTISAVTYEAGDFAANSVLIQSAKEFSLWVGNYSRVGFNHPGPAILYVLGAGEVVFHDWLHLVEYPFAGQVMAVAFYNAFWVTLAFVGFYRLTQSSGVALATLSTLLLMLGLMDHSFFNGIWMPHLYLFPFVVALIAIGRVIDGKTDSLQALALSSGFLINGHVSFVGILGVMLLVSLAGNYLIFRGQSQLGRTVAAPSFLARHKMPLLLSCLTLFVFFVPLIVMTITAFPGPVSDYASFSGGRSPNSLVDAAAYVMAYWGGPLWGTLGLSLLGLAWWACAYAPKELGNRIRSLVVSQFAATLALLFYARYGIDMLGEKYVGLFYYAVPALSIAYAVMILLSQTLLGRIKALVLAGSLVLLAITFSLASKPVPYTQHYALAGIPAVFDGLKAQHPAKGLLVLDLDSSANWPHVWSAVAGFEAYSVRQGGQFFCVNQNWHILFTKAYRCSDEQVRQGKRLVVAAEHSHADKNPIFSALGLSFYNPDAPQVIGRVSSKIVGAAQQFNGYVLSSGWAGLESDRVWSEGKHARILFRPSTTSGGTLKLDLGAFLPSSNATQSVSFVLNGQQVQHVEFSAANPRQKINIAVPENDQEQELLILIDKPVSPQDAGLSTDARKLGVALFTLEFDGEKQ